MKTTLQSLFQTVPCSEEVYTADPLVLKIYPTIMQSQGGMC